MSSSSSLSDGGAIVVGLLLVTVAGVLNGSWNASFSPKHGFAVGRPSSSSSRDLGYHHAWILFQVYAVLLNLPVCLWWAGGPQRTWYLIQNADNVDLFLVSLFAVLWGVGSVCFGIACQIAGVGLGTNLSMGVIVVLGTLLPLIREGTLNTPAGLVVLAGLVICSVGLIFTVQSLQARDACQRQQTKDDENDEEPTTTTTRANQELSPQGVEIMERSRQQELEKAAATTTTSAGNSGMAAATGGNSVWNNMVLKLFASGAAFVGGADQQQRRGNATLNMDHHDEEPTQEDKEQPLTSVTRVDTHDSVKTTTTTTTTAAPLHKAEYSTVQKVAVCVITGIFATQLQFAFVYGEDIIDLAEDNSQGPGSTPPSGSSAIVWLFAITLSAPVSIVYGLYHSPPSIPLSRLWQCPWYRHVLIVLTTSIPWVSHIHLYGYASTLLPDQLAASVAWPAIMMITVLSGFGWGLVLGEWEGASAQAHAKLYQGLVVVAVGVAVIMSSVALDDSSDSNDEE